MISDFDSKIWADPWFMKLSLKERLLFIYLWTNSHKNVAGLYSIGLRTIAFEMDIPQDEIKDTLEALFPKVYYDFKNEVVWVVNHVKHQFYKSGKISPSIIIHIKKNLISQKPHPFVEQFLDNYPIVEDMLKMDGKRHPQHRVSTGCAYSTGAGEGSGKGEDEGKGAGEGEGSGSYRS